MDLESMSSASTSNITSVVDAVARNGFMRALPIWLSLPDSSHLNLTLATGHYSLDDSEGALF